MTSTQPPAWWKGPLGPLTSGRDLCGALHELNGRAVHRAGVHRGVREVDRLYPHREGDRPYPADHRVPGGRPLAPRISPAPLYRVRLERQRAYP
jgi:hypothetical protein